MRKKVHKRFLFGQLLEESGPREHLIHFFLRPINLFKHQNHFASQEREMRLSFLLQSTRSSVVQWDGRGQWRHCPCSCFSHLKLKNNGGNTWSLQWDNFKISIHGGASKVTENALRSWEFILFLLCEQSKGFIFPDIQSECFPCPCVSSYGQILLLSTYRQCHLNWPASHKPYSFSYLCAPWGELLHYCVCQLYLCNTFHTQLGLAPTNGWWTCHTQWQFKVLQMNIKSDWSIRAGLK